MMAEDKKYTDTTQDNTEGGSYIKKKKKKTAAEIKKNLMAYMSKKQGLMGEAARAIKKRNKELENVMKQSK